MGSRRPISIVHAATIVAPGAFAVLLVLTFVRTTAPGAPHLFDFHTFWLAGREYAHGRDPYPAHITGPIDRAAWFVYPAPVAAAFAPLGLLPYAAAWTAFAAVLLAATVLALRLLGVRDPRCFAAAFCALPVLKAVNLGTATPLLLLGVALVWRFRDRAAPAAAAAGAAVLLKLFLWPLVPWLWLTGRRRAAVWSVAGAAAVSAVAWLPLGLGSLGRYPALLHQLSAVEAGAGYSVGASLGGSTTASVAVALAVAGLVVVACRQLPERRALAATVALAVAASPIVWEHYFALALACVALVSPELSALWLVPLAYWALPDQQAWGSLWKVALALSLLALSAVGVPRLRRYVSATVFSSRAAA
jgi:hypothetical protein